MAKQVDLKDVDVYYGDFLAVQDVTLTIPPRAVTAFIGPSGCGTRSPIGSTPRGASLSGGQQQRLCIARALATRPDVLLMDEPCSALDPVSTQAIEDLIARLEKDYTLVIVTHNMPQAARVSDQTAFFNATRAGGPGRLIEIGDTESVFTHPVHASTEDYIRGRFG